MKKILLFGLAGLLVLTTVAVPLNGAWVQAGATPSTTPPEVSVEDAIDAIMNTIFWLFFAIATGFFLLGAYYFLTAGSNPEAANKGKSIITYAIVAVIVAILSKGLSEFLQRMLTGGTVQ